MANLTAAEKLRAALQLQDEKKTPAPRQNTGDNASYQFWNIPENASATVRFLPDKDTDNPFFWSERQVINLPFAGQVGGDYPTDQEVKVTVPCVDMFEANTCPIIAETRPWWKQGPDKEALARLYYKKKSYIFQGFVVSSPFEETSVPENPIRRFMINTSIYEIIKQSLMNPEMEELPTDFIGGRDFKIAKTKKGEYANYGTSTWSFRTRPLNEIENIAIQNFGLFNLADFRGPRPDADGIAMIKQMFHDSVAGKPFDFDAYGKFYRGYSNRKDSVDGDSPPSVSPARTASVSRDNPSRVATPVASETYVEDETKSKPQVSDILDRIRKRSTEKA